MGALSTAVAFGAGYVVGANRDSVVGKVKAKARSVASDLKTRVGRIGGSTANTVIDVRQVSEVMTGVLETVRLDAAASAEWVRPLSTTELLQEVRSSILAMARLLDSLPEHP